MKKFLIAGSSLVAVGAATSANAVDVTLGGSIDMSVEYGMKEGTGLAFGDTTAGVSLSIAAAGTTDGGVKYGGSFSMGTEAEIKFNYYDDNGEKNHFKNTVEEHVDLQAAAYNVSGGQKLNADAIVSVKINSSWMGVNGTKTSYSGAIAAMTSTNICKIAGRLSAGAGATITRLNAAGTKIADLTAIPAAAASGYLPAGRLDGTAAGTAGIKLTAATSNNSVSAGAVAKVLVSVPTAATAAPAVAPLLAGPASVDKLNVGISDVKGIGAAIAEFSDESGDVLVANAAVYAGPFIEVKMQSSTTKMVVGAVCLSGKDSSDTAFYMDNATAVVTASGAKIFVDGGFGKLTLQTSDYAGKVSAIGEAGDEAGISADGLVAIVEGSAMGASVFGAVDLAGALQGIETVVGASFDLSGLSVAVDYKSTGLFALTNANGETTNISGSAWDIGASYSMGDMTAGLAFDSDGDFGASADMSLAGLSVGVVLSSRGNVAHEKTGLDYSITAGTAMNGMSVEVALDQDMKAAATVGYDIGDLNIYAGYDAADNGGKVGAKLSF